MKMGEAALLEPGTLPSASLCVGSPIRPWSLLELLNAYAAAFHKIAQWFDAFAEELDRLGEAPVSDKLRHQMLDQAMGLPFARAWADRLGMTRVSELIFGQETRLTHEAARFRASEVKGWLDNLTMLIECDLGERYLYYVPDDLPILCIAPRKGWGEAPEKFPSAVTDIDEASYCLALGRPTASVLHLMRVLQVGLAYLAVAVNSTIKNPQDQNWHRAIENIEARIKAMQPGPNPAPPPAEELRFYASAALQFTYLKDAFRNYVTHTNVIYKKDDGESIYNHVRDFMAALAERLAE